MKLDKMSEYGLLMKLMSASDPARLVEVRDALRDRLMTARGDRRRFSRLGACVPGIDTLFGLVESHRDFAFGTIFARGDFVEFDGYGDEDGDDGTGRMEKFLKGWKAAEYAVDAMNSVGFEHISEVNYEDPEEDEDDA
jgi:hypothetical protein